MYHHTLKDPKALQAYKQKIYIPINVYLISKNMKSAALAKAIGYNTTYFSQCKTGSYIMTKRMKQKLLEVSNGELNLFT